MTNQAAELIGSGDLARTLGVPHSTVKRWDERGKLVPALRVSGSNRRAWPASALPELERQVSELLRGTGRRTVRTTTVREEVAPTA